MAGSCLALRRSRGNFLSMARAGVPKSAVTIRTPSERQYPQDWNDHGPRDENGESWYRE